MTGTPQVFVFKDFHHLSQNLLLWLASAESQRQKAHIRDPEANHQALLVCREELTVGYTARVLRYNWAAQEVSTWVPSPGLPENSALRVFWSSCSWWWLLRILCSSHAE